MSKLIVSIVFATLLVVALVGSMTIGTAAGQTAAIGTIKATKTVPNISADNKVTVVLTIKNNGTIPITDFEIYEYFVSAFTASASGTISQPSGNSQFSIMATGLATSVQQIVDPPPPNTLLPGQAMTLRYTETAPAAGDYQIPASLIWYSYLVGSTTDRTSIYSNGVTVHIPSLLERTVVEIYPYVLAVTAFAATLTVLFWARRKLSQVDKKKLSSGKGPAI